MPFNIGSYRRLLEIYTLDYGLVILKRNYSAHNKFTSILCTPCNNLIG